MKSHEQKYAEAVTELAARLAAWSVDDPETKAREFMQGMVREGWRGAVASLELPAATDRSRPVDPTPYTTAIRKQAGWTSKEASDEHR